MKTINREKIDLTKVAFWNGSSEALSEQYAEQYEKFIAHISVDPKTTSYIYTCCLTGYAIELALNDNKVKAAWYFKRATEAIIAHFRLASCPGKSVRFSINGISYEALG